MGLKTNEADGVYTPPAFLYVTYFRAHNVLMLRQQSYDCAISFEANLLCQLLEIDEMLFSHPPPLELFLIAP